MANHKSAKKRIRSSAKKRLRNKYYKKSARTAIKNLRDITDKEEAAVFLPKVVSMIDRLAKNNRIHKNKAQINETCSWFVKTKSLNNREKPSGSFRTVFFMPPFHFLSPAIAVPHTEPWHSHLARRETSPSPETRTAASMNTLPSPPKESMR